MNEAKAISLSAEQRDELKRRMRSRTIDARIVLLATDDVGNHEIARRLDSVAVL